MKRVGIIKSEYLFKTIANLFFVEITIYKAIKNKLDKKNKSQNSRSKNKRKLSKKSRKKYPIIYSRHAFIYNSIIMIFYAITSIMVFGITLIAKLTFKTYKFFISREKASKKEKEICTVNTEKVINLVPIIEAKKVEEVKKVLPQ